MLNVSDTVHSSQVATRAAYKFHGSIDPPYIRGSNSDMEAKKHGLESQDLKLES